MQLKIRAVNFHLLVQLPIGLLKQILLEYIRYENERDEQTSATDSDEGSCSTAIEQQTPVLTLVAPREFNSFSINIITCNPNGEEAVGQKVLVQFKTDTRTSVVKSKQDANTEPRCVLQLVICARCRSDSGCSCGWRRLHCVSEKEESLGLLEAIEAKLVRHSPLESADLYPLLTIAHSTRTAKGCSHRLDNHH